MSLKTSKIDWCCSQKEGVSLIEPNQNLADAYIKKAEDSLLSMQINQIKEWKIATAYYTSYFGLYSLLQKIGVKCEIHTCTIEFAEVFLKEFFSKEDIEFLECSFSARKDSQYYVNREVPDKDYNKILINSPDFLIKCKSILLKLTEKKVQEVRNKVKETIEQAKN